MRRFFSRCIFLSVLLLAVAGLTPGCVVAPGGVASGGPVYFSGDLEDDLIASRAQAVAAANAAVTKLRHIKISEESAGTVTTILARTSGDTRVRIQIKYLDETNVRVNIRYGSFGDRELSHVLLREMRQALQ